MTPYVIQPDPEDPRLTERVTGIDQTGQAVELPVVVERPLTLFLNGQEIVTLMTIGDYVEELALGYLLNQNMIGPNDAITGIDYDAEVEAVVVRTGRRTDFEAKLKRKTLTSGCAQGTAFGDVLENFAQAKLSESARIHASWLYAISSRITATPSLYSAAGAIHGCVLCCRDQPLLFMEDVGRHNAVDKIAGAMARRSIDPDDKIFYTTGRLTSEMVIKTVRMGLPILVSRSGFTAWGVQLARQVNLTLIGRARGKRFTVLSGAERVVFDADSGDPPLG